ncbi:MAG: phage gp6-like head-tail connector protein [Stenotrophomonas nitritireducens]|uniref:Phage gp6-like head-tail connector protein n=1 Tax=Stenotrophomonas nitritireducens TaxID=83617 RepID=A0A9D8L332_9GAMM|nr:head-tail connector protein [Stenotrophomonas nitritireducens]MBN8791703.1 phage gp6-like head-tail connector protein [Stenotrophomonas nitritireducens]MBN8795641.1 phage gp6-like head-tail connector protein [Stenotrophomonas nitritireducens]MBN8799175.1 phage gp6-like head-tail connector protein [Stenotrophomonas nitritireducens]
MPIVSLAQARSQVRVEADYPAEQLQTAIDGAVDAAQAYLNRRIYETAAALAAARSAYPAAVRAAATARTEALAAATFIEDRDERTAAIRLAEVAYEEAMAEAGACIHGIVVNPSIVTAILLTIGHLYANRSDVVVGAPAVELPQGAESFLRHYRRRMMP